MKIAVASGSLARTLGEGLEPDPLACSRYLRRFVGEIGGWTASSCEAAALFEAARSADVILVGEFHALPSACETAAELIAHLGEGGLRPILGLELAHGRDQPALDAWLAGRIGERELVRRLRYREEWGYPWSGPGPLLRVARERQVPVLGLDMPPRAGSLALRHRDRVAGERIALAAAAGRPLVAVYGEAHLAEEHLPRAVIQCGPDLRCLRLLHDLPWETVPAAPLPLCGRVDTRTFVHWRRNPEQRVPALARTWRRWMTDGFAAGERDAGGLAHQLAAAQMGELGLDPRRQRLAPGRWLADLFPEILLGRNGRRVGRRLRDERLPPAEAAAVQARLVAAGAVYLTAPNLLLVDPVAPQGLPLESGRFVAAALRGDAGVVAPVAGGALAPAAAEALAEALAALIDPRRAPPSLDPADAEGSPAAAAHACLAAWCGRHVQAAPNQAGAGLAARWAGRHVGRAVAAREVPIRRLRRWLSRQLDGPGARAVLRDVCRTARDLAGAR